MTTSLPSSSWIASMAYKRTPDGATYLVFFVKPYTRANGCQDEPCALLYGGPGAELPSWLPGLIAAGRAKTKSGKGHKDRKGNPWSPGAVYHRMVRGKYQGQRVEGKENVKRLKEMMK